MVVTGIGLAAVFFILLFGSEKNLNFTEDKAFTKSGMKCANGTTLYSCFSEKNNRTAFEYPYACADSTKCEAKGLRVIKYAPRYCAPKKRLCMTRITPVIMRPLLIVGIIGMLLGAGLWCISAFGCLTIDMRKNRDEPGSYVSTTTTYNNGRMQTSNVLVD